MAEAYLSSQGGSGAKITSGSYTTQEGGTTTISLGYVPDCILFQFGRNSTSNIWWFYNDDSIETTSDEEGFTNSDQIASLTSDGFKVRTRSSVISSFQVTYIAVKF